MVRAIVSLIKSDVDRQTAWLAGEARREGARIATTAVLATIAAVAAIGAGIVACMALYTWVAERYGPLMGLAAVGGALAVLAIALGIAAATRKAARSPPRPELRSTDAAALKQALTSDLSGTADQALSLAKTSAVGPAVIAAEDMLRTGTSLYRAGRRQLQDANAPTAVGALVVAGLLGVVLGRRMWSRHP